MSKKLDPIRVILPELEGIQKQALGLNAIIKAMILSRNPDSRMSSVDIVYESMGNKISMCYAKLAGVKIKAASKKRQTACQCQGEPDCKYCRVRK